MCILLHLLLFLVFFSLLIIFLLFFPLFYGIQFMVFSLHGNSVVNEFCPGFLQWSLEHIVIDRITIFCCQKPGVKYLGDSCQNSFLQLYNTCSCVRCYCPGSGFLYSCSFTTAASNSKAGMFYFSATSVSDHIWFLNGGRVFPVLAAVCLTDLCWADLYVKHWGKIRAHLSVKWLMEVVSRIRISEVSCS